MPTLRLTLPFHPAQRQVFEDTHRFRVVAANRRWGKNVLGAGEMVTAFLRGGICWAIANDYPSGVPMFRLLMKLTADLPGVQVNKSDRIITSPRLTDGYMQLRSVGSKLRGEGLDFVLFDEVIDIADFAEIWQGDISPTLASTGGRAMFISSVFTFDHFWDLVVYAQTSGDPDWRAWVFDYTSTPTITPQEIARQKRNLSPARFSREFLSIPVTLGSVFALDDDNKSATPQDRAIEGHSYIVGCDIGGAVDPTVYAVIDLTLQELVHLDAFLVASFTRQVARLSNLCERFNPSAVIVETNNAGESFRQQAEAAGVKNIRALTTSNASKANQVESLVMAFEQHKFKVVNDITLIAQFAAFESQKTASGLVRYAASKGHDDHVLATLIAWAGTDTSKLFFADVRPGAPAYDAALPILWAMADERRDNAGLVVLIAQISPDGRDVTILAEYSATGSDYDASIDAALSLGYPSPELCYVASMTSDPAVLRGRLTLRSMYHTGVQAVALESVRNLAAMIGAGRLQVNPSCKGLLSALGSFRLSDSGVLPVDNAVMALASIAWRLRFWEPPVAPADAGQVDPGLAIIVNFNRWFSEMLRQ